MIDHMTFRVNDIKKTAAFYAKILRPLSYEQTYDFMDEGHHVIGFGLNGKTDIWFSDNKPSSGPTHIALTARSRKAVDDFFSAGLAAGGTDNGKPGLRKEYEPNYYAAFVLDPDGNNVEAVCAKT